jgi:hypothetical protein
MKSPTSPRRVWGECLLGAFQFGETEPSIGIFVVHDSDGIPVFSGGALMDVARVAVEDTAYTFELKVG